ncbi:MAG: hypothetical protein CMH57_09155 [Myxococcales bacterium]|nr:hypothetical protein [Myxococcales bacterium]
MRNHHITSLVAAALCASLALGCGDESAGENSSAPEIDTAALTFSCVMATSEDRFDGMLLESLSVPVMDVDFDLIRVTATVGGAPLELVWSSPDGQPLGDPALVNTQLESGMLQETVHTFTREADSTPLRCETGTAVVIRAVDAAGNVALEEAALP